MLAALPHASRSKSILMFQLSLVAWGFGAGRLLLRVSAPVACYLEFRRRAFVVCAPVSEQGAERLRFRRRGLRRKAQTAISSQRQR